MNAPIAGLIVAAVMSAGCAGTRPPVEMAGAAPSLEKVSARPLDGYPAAVAAIMDVFEQKLGFPRADVTVVPFSDRRHFEEGLRAAGYPPELARSASSFAAIGGARAVLVNA